MFDIDKFVTNLSSPKYLIIGVVVTALFFYLEIYLFGKSIISNEPAQIPVVISLCLGAMWYIIIVGMLSTSKAREKLPEVEKERIISEKIFTSAVFLSPITIASCIGLMKAGQYFLLVFDQHYPSYYFAFTPIVILNFVVVLCLFMKENFDYLRDQKKHSKKKKIE